MAGAAPTTVNLSDIGYSVSRTRATLSRLRPSCYPEDEAQAGPQADFITLVSLICTIYHDRENSLLPIQQFHPDRERYEDSGHACIVSKRAISTHAASTVMRGVIDALSEDIVVKRTRESVLVPRSKGLKSLINELRIRTHPAVREHPNIVRFKGIAWDFEDVEATKPRPLLLEELAPQRTLSGFWVNYEFVRMTFSSKLELCTDIAEGLYVLHQCGVVHGDVKPENILIFPRIGHQDSFMAKLTDFGHSVSVHENLRRMPVWTPEWCAPELLNKEDLDFGAMVATDVYSYGLVILSIVICRSYYPDIEDYQTQKVDGTMFDQAMALIEKEDRVNQDSDSDLPVIRKLLRRTLLQPESRQLRKCMSVFKR